MGRDIYQPIAGKGQEERNIHSVFFILNRLNARFEGLNGIVKIVKETILSTIGTGTTGKLLRYIDGDTGKVGDSDVQNTNGIVLTPAVFQKKLIEQDVTIPTGYFWVAVDAEIASGVDLTVNGDMVVL